MSAARRRSSFVADTALFVDAGFVVALAAVATFAAWPIYATPYMFVTVGGALLLGGGIALVGRLRRWSWLTTTGAVVAAYLVLGVPLAVPRAFASRADFVTSYRDLAVATFGSWRKLLTVDAPVGHFQTLLVPLFITMLVCSAAAFALVFHRVSGYGALVPVMLTPIAFAIAFGTISQGAPLHIAGLKIVAPVHMLVGILAMCLAGGFLVWRAQHARTAALAAASQASGIRRAGGSAANTMRRMAGTVAVVIVGLAVAVPVSATALAPDSRHALSDTVDPVPELSRYVSPLVSYRTAFEPGAYSAPLLSYSGDADAVGRLRIATLSFYDGQNYEVLNSDSDRSHDFQHLPSLIGTAGRGTGLATLGVTIGDYRKLGMPDVWMPTAANLRAISFAGSDANALTDRFYFNPQLQAGAQLRPLAAGDSYTMLVQPPAAAPALATLQPPAGALPSTDHVPAGLTKWVQDQGVGGGGAGLAKLIDRLRARGYLSHSLVAPTGSDTWLTDLAAADRVPAANASGLFEQSLAGESMDRIGAMFDALEQVQNAASKQASDRDLVAAVGDDEQFAVASALIAESLGFPARVVLGFVLDPGMTDGSPIPACDTASKTCAGKNLTAWIEVKTGGAGWVPITTSPQARDKKVTKNTATKDPTIVTQVQPRGATVQPPPEANPTGGTDPSNQHTPKSQPAAATWLPAFRLAGQIATVLLVLLAPFLALVIVKLARRRERRRLADTAARMAAGWDELVDTAVDLGLPGQGIRTRTEAAALYASAARTADPVQMRTLASGADEAVFGAFDPTPAEAEQYWAHLDEQRSRLAAGFPRWKRLRALISLRSFGTRGGGRS